MARNILIAAVMLLLLPHPVHAQTLDGSSGIVVDQSAGTSISESLLDRAQSSWPWYATRASGLVAALALVILMLSGVGFITGRTFSFLEPVTAWATHRALGIIALVSVLIHLAALYFDTFVPFGLKDLLVPFASSYRPAKILGLNFGSLYVALGVLALYVLFAIVLVSLFWINKKPRTWKAIHLFSYLAMAMVFVHALWLGTDLASGSLRVIWVAAGVAIFVASLFRLWRAKTL